MIDPSLPLELDDGRDCQLVEVSAKMVRVTSTGCPGRTEGFHDQFSRSGYWFSREDGHFIGQNKKRYHFLRNRDDENDYVLDVAVTL